MYSRVAMAVCNFTAVNDLGTLLFFFLFFGAAREWGAHQPSSRMELGLEAASP